MVTIVISELDQSEALDVEKMREVAGGSPRGLPSDSGNYSVKN